MNKKLVFLFSMVAAIGVTILISNMENSQSDSEDVQNDMFEFKLKEIDDGTPKAIIIDQLYNDKPNEKFQTTITKYLKDAGYKVDIITTDEITVGFYKELPSMNYEYIIIRTHSLGYGALEKSPSPLLFTGETHDYHKYVKEQYLGQVGQGLPYLQSQVQDLGGGQSLLNNTYFVVGSKLFDDAAVDNFPGSTIILSGCETLEKSTLAESLINRGASEVVGWSGLIGFENNDSITMHIIKENLVNNIEMKEVVESTKAKNEGYLNYDTELVYFS